MPVDETKETIFADCTGCGSKEIQESMVFNESFEPFCNDCYANTYRHCDCCDGETHYESMMTTPGSDEYCEDCYHDNVSYCESCDEDFWQDDMEYNEPTGENLCSSCWEDENYRNGTPDWEVHSNNYVKTSPTFVNPDNDSYKEDTFSLIKSMRYQGIEIESNFNNDISKDDLYYHISQSIKKTRDDYQDSDTYARINIVYDGSVTGGDDQYGYELVMQPRRGDILYTDMLTATKRLKDVGGYISSKCGYHLHIDTRDYDWQHFLVLVLMTKAIEPHIYSWLPSSRRSSNWCRPVSQSIDDLKWITDRDSFIEYYYDHENYSSDKYNNKRYHGLNLHSHFQANQGIEIRYHSGTLNADKMLHWSILWSQIIDKCYDLGNKLADEMRDNDISNLYQTSLFKSLNTINILQGDKDIISSLKSHYFDDSSSTDIVQYRSDSVYLSNLLGLDAYEKGKYYAVEPMLKFLSEANYTNPTMTIDSLFSLFEIPVITQEFYKERMLEIMENPQTSPNHIRRCFEKSDMFVDFDEKTMEFGVAKVMNGVFPTIDSQVIKNCKTRYNLQYCKTEVNAKDYDGFILTNPSLPDIDEVNVSPTLDEIF
mgnify:CR=1 FL=1